MSRTWPCDLNTKVSGDLSRLDSSHGNHSRDFPFPPNLLKQICSCAGIDATFSTNPDGTNKITLVNNGSPAVLQCVKLSVIDGIIKRAVIRKSPEQIKAAAEKAQLQKVISWKIYDFSGEGPGEPLCLFMYSRKDLRDLPLTSFDRIDTDEYLGMMQSFRNMLK